MYFVGKSENGNIVLEYYITNSKEPNEHTGCYEWGIRVDKITPEKEREEIKNISPDFEKVLMMAEVLRRNTVTPIGLKYAVQELISS